MGVCCTNETGACVTQTGSTCCTSGSQCFDFDPGIGIILGACCEGNRAAGYNAGGDRLDCCSEGGICQRAPGAFYACVTPMERSPLAHPSFV